MRAGRGAHLAPRHSTVFGAGSRGVGAGRGTRIGIGVLGGCGVATAVVVALIGVLGNGNGTIPQASSTGPQKDSVPRSAPSEPPPDSPGRGDEPESRLWSGDYTLRSTMNLELDQGDEPRIGDGAANEIWMENYGDSGHIVYTDGTLAPWDIQRTPNARQCRRAVEIGGTTRLRVTVEDEGKGICLRTTERDRYAYFSLATIDRSGIRGDAVVWSVKS